MEITKIKNKGQARLFDNVLLETMTKTRPVVIYCIYFPIIALMLYYGARYKGIAPITEAGLFAGGVLFWTLFEYIMHRYVFHMVAESEAGSKLIHTMHGVHHEYPRDKDRLFMPPVPSLLISGTICLIMFALMQWKAFSVFPGFMFGYLLYASMHYAIHAYAPPQMLKGLWRNHYLHHYKTPDKGFGVSSVLWDIVFGTVPRKEDAQEE